LIKFIVSVIHETKKKKTFYEWKSILHLYEVMFSATKMTIMYNLYLKLSTCMYMPQIYNLNLYKNIIHIQYPYYSFFISMTVMRIGQNSA